MRISELRGREDFDELLARTLARGLEEQFRRPQGVSRDRSSDGQVWCEHPVFSCLHVRDPSRAVRRWMVESFRYTPRLTRLPVQFALGMLLGTRPAIRALSRPTLWMDPPLPDARHRLILPGNRRIRLFDFQEEVSRVLLKEGFDSSAIAAEVAVRGRGREGPFPPIERVDPDGRWFEERLVHGFVLPRCPPWLDRRSYEGEAFRRLSEWHARRMDIVSAQSHAEALVDRIGERCERLRARFGETMPASARSVIEEWTTAATSLGSVEIVESHGDFQPGNVIVESESQNVWLVDWEHTDFRFSPYDRFVYGLRMRSPAGLKMRVQRYLETGRLDATVFGPEDPELRKSWMAMTLLEDLLWRAEEAVSGPYSAPPPDWTVWCSQMLVG